MRAVNMSDSLNECSATYPIDAKSIKACAGCHNIGDRVFGPNLVEPDILRWHTVDGSLGNGDSSENG